MPYYAPPSVPAPVDGSGAPPIVIYTGETYVIPDNKQVLVAVPIELQEGASLEREGTGVLVILR